MRCAFVTFPTLLTFFIFCVYLLLSPFKHALFSWIISTDEVPDDKEQSNAPHPAALTKPLQKLVDEIRSFGRLPKKNMGDSAEDQLENKLYWRYVRSKDKIPEDLFQEDDKEDELDIFSNCQTLHDCVLLSLY